MLPNHAWSFEAFDAHMALASFMPHELAGIHGLPRGRRAAFQVNRPAQLPGKLPRRFPRLQSNQPCKQGLYIPVLGRSMPLGRGRRELPGPEVAIVISPPVSQVVVTVPSGRGLLSS